MFKRKGGRKKDNHSIDFGKKYDANDVKVLEQKNKKLELKRDIKKNKQDFKASTSADRAAVKKSRVRTIGAAYQAKQAHETTKETVKQDAETRKELAKIEQQMRESDNQVELERIKAGKVSDNKVSQTKESTLINGGMENTHLSSPDESNSSKSSSPSYNDPDKDGSPGYSWGMI